MIEQRSPDDQPLRIALPKGRLLPEVFAYLQTSGISTAAGDTGRKLIVPSADGCFDYVMAKPSDVPVYVEYGAADLGICGLDVLREQARNVYEPLLLPFGHCRLSLCGPGDRPRYPLRYESQPRVATTFPNLTREFFRRRGVNAEIITLKGSVELAPLVNLADLIVDLVETGSTLRANGLVEIRTILDSQAVLIVNRSSYRLRSDIIQNTLEHLRSSTENESTGT